MTTAATKAQKAQTGRPCSLDSRSIAWRRRTTRSRLAKPSSFSASRRIACLRDGFDRGSACSRSAAAPAPTRCSSRRLGARVVACDPSEEMLSRTRRRLEIGRPRRSRRHPVVRSARSAAVPRRARSRRRLRCDRLEFRRAQLRAVARSAWRHRPPASARRRRDGDRPDGPHLFVGDAVLHRARRSPERVAATDGASGRAGGRHRRADVLSPDQRRRCRAR